MTPLGFDEEGMGDQEAAGILLLKVALRLLGEARLRGSFGEEEITRRAATLADESTGGAPSPDPRRALVEASLIRPDRISLSAPFAEGSAVTESLMLDGTLYDGGTVASFGMHAAEVDPQELSPEERADLERRQAEWQALHERMGQFTATQFVRAVAAPPQPGAESHVLAVLLYEDGFYVDLTYDAEPPQFDPEMTDHQFLAHEEDPEIKVEDDLGTEYFRSGGGGGGGVQVSHSSLGFAPAPPAEAQLLRITAADETVSLKLRR